MSLLNILGILELEYILYIEELNYIFEDGPLFSTIVSRITPTYFVRSLRSDYVCGGFIQYYVRFLMALIL